MIKIAIITNKKGGEVASTIMNHLKCNSSSENKFTEKLNGPIYTDNPGACIFFLLLL